MVLKSLNQCCFYIVEMLIFLYPFTIDFTWICMPKCMYVINLRQTTTLLAELHFVLSKNWGQFCSQSPCKMLFRVQKCWEWGGKSANSTTKYILVLDKRHSYFKSLSCQTNIFRAKKELFWRGQYLFRRGKFKNFSVLVDLSVSTNSISIIPSYK